MLTTKELAIAITEALENKKGVNIKVVEITEVSSLADYFVICTGTSNTHVNALCDSVEKDLDKLGEPMLRREGHRSGTWVLQDYGSVVLHVFTEETRQFYDLERMWVNGTPVALDTIISE